MGLAVPVVLVAENEGEVEVPVFKKKRTDLSPEVSIMFPVNKSKSPDKKCAWLSLAFQVGTARQKTRRRQGIHQGLRKVRVLYRGREMAALIPSPSTSIQARFPS